MATIEIDGKQLEVTPGSMIIEAADAANIYIPRFCYHKKLSIAANCRMCLVEVEKSGKPLPACATPVTDGMKVFTRTPKALEAQKTVMEFLLINHPLDCPICDQGGECELQDLSMGFGRDNSPFDEEKRAVTDDDLGPLIASNMTRCIHCTRCVRFGQEIAGVRELGMTGRGEHAEITTYVKHTLASELSGNIIDLCPVGALTSKPYRFRARAWELQQKPSIAAHDCVGSHINVHERRGRVLRVVPRDAEQINENWLSDRDRFSYSGLYHEDRLTQPKVKKDGVWHDSDWTTAFEMILAKTQKIIDENTAEQLAGLISPSATTEELFLFQKFLRRLGCDNIDHRIHQSDFSSKVENDLFPGLPIAISEIAAQNKIWLVGSNLQREQPILAHWVRQASLQDADVFALNVVNYQYYFATSKNVVVDPREFVIFIAEIAKYLITQKNYSVSEKIAQALKDLQPSEAAIQQAQKLLADGNKLILLGAVAQNQPQANLIKQLIALIAQLTQAKVAYLTEGANAAGAWIAGALPHRKTAGEKITQAGLDAKAMFAQARKGYFLFGLEPDADCANPIQINSALKQAELVVAFTAFNSEFLNEHADVLLPIVPFTETSGTFVNVEGRWQSFAAAVQPFMESRPGWKVLRVLGNFFKCDGFDYLTSEAIADELKNATQNYSAANDMALDENVFDLPRYDEQLFRITEWPLNRIDYLTRRSIPLQQSMGNEKLGIYINNAMAKRLGLDQTEFAVATQGEHQVKLPLFIDDRIHNNCVWLPGGYAETGCLGESFGTIKIEADHD